MVLSGAAGLTRYLEIARLVDLLAKINRSLSKAFSRAEVVRVFWLERQRPSQAKSKIVARIPRWAGRLAGLCS